MCLRSTNVALSGRTAVAVRGCLNLNVARAPVRRGVVRALTLERDDEVHYELTARHLYSHLNSSLINVKTALYFNSVRIVGEP